MHTLSLRELFRAVTKLLDSGWTIPEIERLSRFRNRFQHTSEDVLTVDIRHLEFIRWLVQASRLTDW